MPDDELITKMANLSGPSSSPSIPSLSTRFVTQNDIKQTVNEILNNTLGQLVKDVLNPNKDFAGFHDQSIREEFQDKLGDLDKLPDVVWILRDFSGSKSEFNSWKKSVERVLKLYEKQTGSPKFYGILLAIRNKIVGEADAVLESYNTPLDWKAISKCLTANYADKRDLKTLEYQLYSLSQGNQSVQEFYQVVYHQLSLILNQIGSLDASQETIQALTALYRDKALDTFVRGLNGNLSQLLAIKEPYDLGHALHLRSLLENQKTRNHQAPREAYTRQQPQIPPRRNFAQTRPTVTRQNFQPNLYYQSNPQVSSPFQRNPVGPSLPWSQQPPMRTQYFSPQGQNGSTPPPRPQPKPVPMEVDSSVRSRNVNYMNRPNFEPAGKRPLSMGTVPHPNKMQRQFNIQTESYTEPQPEPDTDADEQAYYEALQTAEIYELQEEVAWQPDDDQNEMIDIAELHFLE